MAGLKWSKTVDQDLELAPNFYAGNVTCYYEKPGVEIVYKFYLVALFGTSIALISFVENTPLFYIFFHRQHFRQSHYFYLTFLAFFDIVIAISYIMLFTVQVLFDYLESPGLSATWHFYLSPIFTVSKVSLAAAGYLVVATTLERFLVTNRLVSYAFDQTCRSLAVLVSIFAAVLFNGMVYFEVTVIEAPNCTNMARYAASTTSLMENSAYKAIFTFWIRNIFTAILPFLLLASMNVSIVLRMLTEHESAKRFYYDRASSVKCRKRFGSSIDEGQKNLQLATRTLVLIVTSYLIANVPSIILTTWEFVDFSRLHSIDQGKFYSFAADVVSILTVVCGALRLPIYVYCNQKVSRELKNLLMMKMCLNHDSGSSPASSTSLGTSAVRYTESKEMEEFVAKYNRVSVSTVRSPGRSQDDYSSGFNSISSVDVEIAQTRIWDPSIVGDTV